MKPRSTATLPSAPPEGKGDMAGTIAGTDGPVDVDLVDLLRRSTEHRRSDALSGTQTGRIHPDIALNTSHIGMVEYGIRPTMAGAITLPVWIDGVDVGISVYVVRSAFAPVVPRAKMAQQLTAVAARLQIKKGGAQ